MFFLLLATFFINSFFNDFFLSIKIFRSKLSILFFSLLGICAIFSIFSISSTFFWFSLSSLFFFSLIFSRLRIFSIASSLIKFFFNEKEFWSNLSWVLTLIFPSSKLLSRLISFDPFFLFFWYFDGFYFNGLGLFGVVLGWCQIGRF